MHNLTFPRWHMAMIGLLLSTLACGSIGDAINANPAVQTGQAVATQAGELGELAETAQAMATDIGPGPMETVVAAATDLSESGIAETAQAVVTAVEIGERPEDIPYPDTLDESSAVFTTYGGTYNVKQPYADVVQYYKDEMPNAGWTLESDLSLSDTGSIVTYSRTGREAIFTFTALDDSTTTVILVVSDR